MRGQANAKRLSRGMRGNTLARALRRNTTDAEAILWRHLRNRRLKGWKFRRQHPVGPYIVDFACPAASLVVELDGGQHADRAEADAARSARLRATGYTVLRFWNNEIFANLEGVLTRITEALEGHVSTGSADKPPSDGSS